MIVALCGRDEAVVDPGSLANWRICEPVSNRLGTRLLDVGVARQLLEKVLRSRDGGLLFLCLAFPLAVVE